MARLSRQTTVREHAHEASDAPTLSPSPALLDSVVERSTDRPAQRVDGIATGRLDALDTDGRITLSIPSLGLERSSTRSSLVTLRADHIGCAIAVGFESGDPSRPIVLGVMLDAPVPPASQAQAIVDGESVVLRAEHEIELRCGDAAIVLTADGRITLRGTYITSHASATQRILGGSVNVN